MSDNQEETELYSPLSVGPGGDANYGKSATVSIGGNPGALSNPDYIRKLSEYGEQFLGKSPLEEFNKIGEARDSAATQKYAAINRAMKNLRTAGTGDSNLPLMAAASGFLAPTRGGSFGESLSHALADATPQIQRQRQTDFGRAQVLGNLDVAGAETSGDLAKDRAKDFLTRIQLGEKFLQAAGADSARLAMLQNAQNKVLGPGSAFITGAPGSETPGTPGAPSAANAQPQQVDLGAGLIQITMPDGRRIIQNRNSGAIIGMEKGDVPAYLKESGKEVSKFIDAKQQSVAGIGDSLRAVDELEHSLKGLPTGPGTVSVTDASSFAQRFGIDLNSVLPEGWQADPTKANIAQKNISQLAAAWAKGNFPQRITNVDMMVAERATPNLWNTPEANKVLLGNLRDVMRMKQEEAKFYRTQVGELRKKGQVPGWDIMDAWSDHLAKMKDIPDSLKSSYLTYSDLANNPQIGQSQQKGAAWVEPAGAPTAQGQPDGARLKDGQGNVIAIARGGKWVGP